VIPLKGELELLQDITQIGVKVDSSFTNLRLIKQIAGIRKCLKKNDYIMHGHLPRAELLIRIAFPFKRFLVTRHNSERFFPSAPKFVSILLSRFVAAHAYKVISISNAVKTYLLKSKEISSNSELEVIYYGYIPSSSIQTKNINLKESNFSKMRTLELITVGRLEPQKNIRFLIESVAFARSEGFSCRLSILGSGREGNYLSELAKDLDIQEYVQFLGRSPNVFTELLKANIFVFSSHYEGFGLALLEAMEAGLPIAAPNHSCIPEVLGYQHPGLYESGNHKQFLSIIRSFATDNGMVEKVLNIQKSRLDYFHIEKYFSAHHQLYLDFSCNYS